MSTQLYIPVFSERIQRNERGKVYRVVPAFRMESAEYDTDDFEIVNPREDRAIDELTRVFRRMFNELSASMRHDQLLRWSFFPDPRGKKIAIQVYLRKQSVTGDIFVITYQSMGRRIVTIPKIPQLSFELPRGIRIEDRVNEMLTHYFRKQEKKADGKLDLDQYLSEGQSRLTMIELTIRTRQKYKKPEPISFAMLGGNEKMSGAQELENIGRCLNRLYPKRLSRAVLRETQVDAVREHFSKGKKTPQPLILIGKSQAGKTAIIHEYLFRQSFEDVKPKRDIWLISPQRMISGMSFVGQWEERAHAIFKEAVKRKHILYFEDLPGLFQAGKTRDSDLTVGHVLKAYFEEGNLDVIAEGTHESWRKLRELDRGFADFFRTLPIEETSHKDTLRILIRTVQELEGTHTGTYLEPALIPTVYELQNRFARAHAFPGKAVEVINQLARKYSNRELDREDLFDFFQAKTGIRQQFLRQRYRVERSEIEAFFEDRIKGQPDAVNAMANLVITCLSQLNEPGRPMGSLLFLGPTGVGKTECAKTLSEYFFGTQERLIRFDMNEFVGYDAVERLIGSTFRPRGLLTSAVRRQPYSVVLLDEIEKAHPIVFDLLLQLLGDGRLTDASGQTADFCNTIVVMTSNLGARSAKHNLGFAGGESNSNSHVYREAAEKFFRPELFNRLDSIVPFRELSEKDIESLVSLMCEKALDRIGISETQLNLKIQPDVYQQLAKMGFKPEFGARALRRSVEEYLIEPIALELSNLPKNKPAVVTVSNSETGLTFSATELHATKRSGAIINKLSIQELESFIVDVNHFLDRIEDDLESWRDESNDGVIDPTDPIQIRYFSLREDIVGIRRMRDHLSLEIDREYERIKQTPEKPSPHSTTENLRFIDKHSPEVFLNEMYRTSDSAKYINRHFDATETHSHLSQIASNLIYRANALALIVSKSPEQEDRCLIQIKGPDRDEISRCWQYNIISWLEHSDIHQIQQYFRTAEGEAREFISPNDSDFDWNDYANSVAIVASGPAIYDFVKALAGTSLLIRTTGKAAFADINIHPIDETIENTPNAILGWRDQLSDPESMTVATIQTTDRSTYLDLASGCLSRKTEHRAWQFINPHLPVVEELRPYVKEM